MYSLLKKHTPKFSLHRINNFKLRNIKKGGFESPIKEIKYTHNPVLKIDGCTVYKGHNKTVNGRILKNKGHRGFYPMF